MVMSPLYRFYNECAVLLRCLSFTNKKEYNNLILYIRGVLSQIEIPVKQDVCNVYESYKVCQHPLEGLISLLTPWLTPPSIDERDLSELVFLSLSKILPLSESPKGESRISLNDDSNLAILTEILQIETLTQSEALEVVSAVPAQDLIDHLAVKHLSTFLEFGTPPTL